MFPLLSALFSTRADTGLPKRPLFSVSQDKPPGKVVVRTRLLTVLDASAKATET